MLENAIPMKTDARHVLIERITDGVRKGKYAEDRMSHGMEQLLRDFGISDHWITQIKYTYYLRPKASLINDTLDDLYYVWYRMQDFNNDDGSEGNSYDDE